MKIIPCVKLSQSGKVNIIVVIESIQTLDSNPGFRNSWLQKRTFLTIDYPAENNRVKFGIRQYKTSDIFFPSPVHHLLITSAPS